MGPTTIKPLSGTLFLLPLRHTLMELRITMYDFSPNIDLRLRQPTGPPYRPRTEGGGVTLYQPCLRACPKVKDMDAFLASSE